MDRYLVVGQPVEHSQSPFIHAAFAAQTGQVLRYERRAAPRDGFAATLAAIGADGVLGCNVTVPFKEEACRLAAVRSDRAALAGAANVLTRGADGGWHADNSDGAGLVADLRRHAGFALRGARILLIGAGGAAAGCLGPLLDEAPAALVVANRSLDRARALVDRHRAPAHRAGARLDAVALDDCGAGHDLVVNASASSLEGAAPPVAPGTLRPGTLAVDLMYGPAAAPFLAWAAAHGARPRDGLGMLVEQAAVAFRAWRGVAPDTAPVLAALRERLGGPRA